MSASNLVELAEVRLKKRYRERPDFLTDEVITDILDVSREILGPEVMIGFDIFSLDSKNLVNISIKHPGIDNLDNPVIKRALYKIMSVTQVVLLEAIYSADLDEIIAEQYNTALGKKIEEFPFMVSLFIFSGEDIVLSSMGIEQQGSLAMIANTAPIGTMFLDPNGKSVHVRLDADLTLEVGCALNKGVQDIVLDILNNNLRFGEDAAKRVLAYQTPGYTSQMINVLKLYAESRISFNF